MFLSCLSSLSVRNEYCQQASDKNGLKLVLELLVDPDQNPKIVKESLLLLSTLAGNDNVKNDIRAIGCIGIIVDAVLKNIVSIFIEIFIKKLQILLIFLKSKHCIAV